MRSVFLFVAFALFFLVLAGGVRADINDDLVAYYNFSDSSNRASYGNITGSSSGTVTRVNASACASGECLQFNSTDGSFVTNYNLTGDFTINFWIQTMNDVSSSTTTLVTTGMPTSGSNFSFRGARQTAKNIDSLYYYVGNTNMLCYGASGDCAWETNTSKNKFMITITYNSTSGASLVYINGTQKGTKTLQSGINHNKPITIGDALGQTGVINYKGWFDEIAVYNTVKSSTDISSLWNSGSGNFYFYTPITPIPPVPDLEITAFDVYDNSSISSFSANVTYTPSPVSSVLGGGVWFDDFESYEANRGLQRNSYIPQQSNVVAYYSFDGCNANDATGVNNGTVSGATCQEGILGNNSYSFNGISNSINLSNINQINSTNPYSIALRFSVNSSSTFYTLFTQVNTSSDLLIINVQSGDMRIGHYNGSYNGVRSGSVTPFTSYLAIYTYSNGTGALYLNNINQTGTSSPSASTTLGTRIGRRTDNSGYLNGSVDEVIIWNRVLSYSEATELYNMANSSYRPQSGVAYNVTSGIVSVGNYGAGGVGDRGLVCGLGGGLCQLTKTITPFAVTPTLSLTAVRGTANITYSSGMLYINISDGGVIDDVIAFENNTNATVDSVLYCPALRRDSTDAILSCNVYEDGTQTYDLSDGLVAYYPFDEGWNANDATGLVNGTVGGATSIAGISGTGAYDFDGNDHINITMTQNLTSFSISAWIIPDSISGNMVMLDSRPAANYNSRLYFATATNQLRLGVGNTTGSTYNSFQTIAANEKIHAVGVYNGTHFTMYKNGVNGSWIEKPNGLIPSTNTYQIGVQARDSASYFNGVIDDVRIYNRTLSADEVRALYDYGFPGSRVNGSSSGFGNVTDVNLASERIKSSESVPVVTSTTFVPVRNSFSYLFSTTNGTIITTISSALKVLLTSIEVTSTDYFPATYNDYNTSTDLTASMYQAEVGFTATEIISGNSAGEFTVCAPLQCATGTNPTLYLAAGNYNVTFNKTGWYNQTFPITVTALTSTTQNLTGVYKYILNITATNYAGGASESNFTIIASTSDYNYTTTTTTTNGTVTLPWVSDNNTNLTLINATTLASTSTSINTTNYTTPVLINITIQSYTTNTLLIAFYDEETGELINTERITLYVTGEEGSYNYTTDNGYLNATFLVPQTYILTYLSSNYTQRESVITLADQEALIIGLYLLRNDSGTYIRFTVLDQTYQTLSNATINANRKNLSGTNYYNVQDCVTDSNGECLMFLQTLTSTYRFLTEYEDVVRTSSDTVLSRDTYTIVINTETSTLQNVLGRDDITAGLNFTGTDSFYYTVNDANNLVTTGELVIERRYGGRWYPVNSTSASGSSFTLSITGVNTTLGDEVRASGYVNINGDRILTHTTSVIESEAGNALGGGLAFLFLGMAFTIVFIFAWNPVAPLVAFAAFLIIMSRVGLIAIGGGAVVAVLVVVAIAVYRMRSV